MDTLSFEQAFDPIEIDFYADVEYDEPDRSDLSNTDESTTVLD